jgi:hypothetical protein
LKVSQPALVYPFDRFLTPWLATGHGYFLVARGSVRLDTSVSAYKEPTITEAVFRANAIAVSEGLAEPIRGNSAGPAT